MTDYKPNYRLAAEKALDALIGAGYAKPPIDPEVIAEDLGIRVVYADFGKFKEDVSGFLDFDAPRIVINKDIAPTRKVFTIAHELGHFLMHKEYAKGANYKVMPRSNLHEDKPSEEKEADAFAANLLVPDDMLRRYKHLGNTKELAKAFLVSEEVITNRLKFI